MAHIRSNTTKDYPCVQCGGPGNIIREGADPRVKCNNCNFMYDASQSTEAKEKGAIPDGAPKLQEPTTTNERNPRTSDARRVEQSVPLQVFAVPRTPAYVIVRKDRSHAEFVTRKDFKKRLLRWTAGDANFDVFELQPKKVSAKIEVD